MAEHILTKSSSVDGTTTEKKFSPINDLHDTDTLQVLVAEDLDAKQTWRSFFWDTFDKPPEERRFLFKLDAIVLTLACLGSFIKYLDQVNVSNAFVSGMEEDLGLYGDQLNYMVTCWTVGYTVGQIPSNLILSQIRPSIWIPACEVVWAVLTILMVICKNVNGLYALRFFIGLADSAFNPGIFYLLGSWYRKDELAKRAALFTASSFAGAMFSGYLMAASYNLDGKNGLHGWQWLFIVDGIISLPIGVAGFFLLPDLPDTTGAWWLSKQDVSTAKERVRLENRAPRGAHSLAKFKSIFQSWHIYALTLLYVLFNNNGNYGGQPGFQLWLESIGYPTKKVDTLPTAALAIAFVFALIFGWTSDSLWRGTRWPPILFASTANIIINASLAAWDINIGWKWTCFFLGGLPNGLGALIMAWATEICGGDNEERAVVIATMNTMGEAVSAWLPLIIWKTVDAPRYHKGFMTMIFIALALIAMTLVTRFLHQREKMKKERNESSDLD
ncbi:major facilitator superfamily domain-containing protein [Penicillium malachiteum]|uniref:major facilitator superfamily domain-containing protein n=1 Tax=Penicillium malachiteum TaxID=1324776 RepID=UPI0025478128|nr:major facilitator superfamily domain-containing protein [Penicillium malachiteum]KAJ5736905.1 major facilitator superfamily domain-containing protein [Penicillium malachiteum]